MTDISLLLAEYDSEQHESLQKSMADIQTSLRDHGEAVHGFQTANNHDMNQAIASEKSSTQTAHNHLQKIMHRLDDFMTVRSEDVAYTVAWTLLIIIYIVAQGRCIRY